MKSLPVLALVLSALLPSSLPAQDAAALHASLVTRRPDGLLVIHPPVVPAEMNNPWTPEQEERFIRQSNRFLELARSSSYGLNTYFENEKRWFGYAMMQFLATGQEKPLKDLQTQDHQHAEWHRETRGIDWYAAFTIKHQVRKYFLLGPGLQPEHREAMREGARLWTEQDPLHRPHYTFQPERRDQGWGPDARNSWVDIRSTDNLLWMRDVAVYLMAEETGNRETAAKYKEKIRRFVVAIYRVGTGEWDSHNYFSHATAPVHTLFDYAKDPEVRLLAKAALDHYYAAAAVKYRNGAWNGPTKRDYNAIRPMTASPSFFALHFGNNPVLGDLDSDVIHALTSAYRPPMAVIALADKKGLPGTELFIAHASYEDPRNGRYDIQPSYHETQYFGHSFQLGTLSDGTEDPDANGFKIVADDTKTGAEMLQLVPGSDPLYPGSPQYQSGKLHGQGRVAQYGQTAIYLVRPGSAPWTWVLPNSTEIVRDGDFLFLKHANTWVAYRGLNVDLQGIDAEKTAQLREERKRVKVGAKEVANPPDWLVPGSLEVDAKNQNWGVSTKS